MIVPLLISKTSNPPWAAFIFPRKSERQEAWALPPKHGVQHQVRSLRLTMMGNTGGCWVTVTQYPPIDRSGVAPDPLLKQQKTEQPTPEA